MTQEQFIKEIAKYVQKYAPQYNIKVCSPIIAQAILESASGTSELAVNANNYFGLKYRPGRCPSASGIYYKVGSEQKADGSYVSSAMQWMKFSNMENGVKGYFDFTNIANYKSLKGVTNPETYLKNIKAAGYATSLKYVDNLMAVIKKYNLTQYDTIADNKKEIAVAAYKVAIDAGHGSTTAGKRTPDGYKEHWINVKTAYYCEQLLKQHGIEVLRVAWDDTNATDDTDVPLSTRQKLIKNAKCDLSVSMHANAFGNGVDYNSAEGVSTHVHSVESYRGDSYELAKLVQEELIKGTAQKNRGIVLQNLAMCNCVNMGTKAACLIEIAFMTNLREAELMKTEHFCKEQGEDIARGILRYLDIVPKKSTTPIPAIKNPTVSNQVFKSYIVQITASALNIRKGPGTNYTITGCIRDKGKYTIVEEKDGFGKLKSGAGWISLKYTKKI